MTYSDWRVELSEKYKVFKGLYKIIKTPTVIKAAPKQKLKNAVGISYKKSMGTLDYRRSIFPDYKANRSNRFARIKATPSGDPMADISQNIYKKEGKKSLERRLAAKEKQRQEWLKANNLPSSSSAQPPHFNEGVASLALKGGSKLIPALITGIGAAGTIMQARKSGKFTRKVMKGKVGDNQKVKPELLDAIRKKQAEDKSKKEKVSNTSPDVMDAMKQKQAEVDKIRKKKGRKQGVNMSPTKNRVTDKIDAGVFKRGKIIDKETRRRMNAPENQFNSYNPLGEEAPTNNVGGGQIAGTVEAGDDPPVKKKKRYIYGGKGSRRMWMNNK